MDGLLLKHELERSGVTLTRFSEAAGWRQTKVSGFVQQRRKPRVAEINKILRTLKRLKIKINKDELFPELKEISEFV